MTQRTPAGDDRDHLPGHGEAVKLEEEQEEGAGEHGRLRASAIDIYVRVKREAKEELRRPVPALGFSGLFAGATVGFGPVAAAAAATAVGGGANGRLVGALFFPIGFIVVIIGRAQLFTENTLYPVALVLDERRYLGATLRLWAVVLSTNLVGATLFALYLAESGGISGQIARRVSLQGLDAAHGTWPSFFWSAVLGGWAIALVAWLIQSSGVVIGQIVLIWVLAFMVGVVGLDHCISTSVEVLTSVFEEQVSFGHAADWFSAVLLGNIVGGALITALVNYGQVRAGAD